MRRCGEEDRGAGTTVHCTNLKHLLQLAKGGQAGQLRGECECTSITECIVRHTAMARAVAKNNKARMMVTYFTPRCEVWYHP